MDLKNSIIVNKSSSRINKVKSFRRLTTLALLILLILQSTLYLFAIVQNTTGAFTINLDKDLAEKQSISLSESKKFKKSTTLLSADPLERADNITQSDLPKDIDKIDGAHNGTNYVAYTFYIKNAGSEVIDYEVQINILSTTLGADEAIRIKVYKNGKATVYAKERTGSHEPEPDTVAFKSDSLATKNTRSDFRPNDMDKYTVVVWLEGNDPECVDDILGGEVKMEMNFKIAKEK